MPACDGWDSREKTAGPHAPYLLQGAGHPSQIAYGKIRSRLARLSRQAGATRSDGSTLVLRPHDCRRVFASEHLNNNTPIHVIQALLGHATPDTVMVYAKLYPATLIDEYRKAVRATYLDFHGPDSDRVPDAAEWQRFSKAWSFATPHLRCPALSQLARRTPAARPSAGRARFCLRLVAGAPERPAGALLLVPQRESGVGRLTAMPVEPSAVTRRAELVAFIVALRDEHRADPEAWENNDLFRFLDALAAWVDDSPGYWANEGQPEPEQPDWSWVALSLRAATQYE